eukprot:scaffold107867_cov23-Tisochrysis_lutea.AAC.3
MWRLSAAPWRRKRRLSPSSPAASPPATSTSRVPAHRASCAPAPREHVEEQHGECSERGGGRCERRDEWPGGRIGSEAHSVREDAHGADEQRLRVRDRKLGRHAAGRGQPTLAVSGRRDERPLPWLCSANEDDERRKIEPKHRRACRAERPCIVSRAGRRSEPQQQKGENDGRGDRCDSSSERRAAAVSERLRAHEERGADEHRRYECGANAHERERERERQKKGECEAQTERKKGRGERESEGERRKAAGGPLGVAETEGRRHP